MRYASPAQRAIIQRDWPNGVDVGTIRERLNALIPDGGRHFTNNRQVKYSAHFMGLSKPPVPPRFSPERDAIIREMRPAGVPNIDILAALLGLPGDMTITTRDVHRRAVYLAVRRPVGFRDYAASARNGKSEKCLATLAANRERRSIERATADPSTRQFSPARDAVLREMRAAGAVPRAIHEAVLALPGLPVTLDQCGKRAAYIGAYALPQPKKAPQPRRARQVKSKTVKVKAAPKPARIPERAPTIDIPRNSAWVRLPMSQIRAVAEQDGWTVNSGHSLQKFNAYRERAGKPVLYLPVNDRGRAMV